MTISEFARSLRHQDWTACMSESFSALGSHEASLERLQKEASSQGSFWLRVFELGVRHESAITWTTWDEPSRSDAEIKDMAGMTRAERFESGWRWVQAFLEAHGVPCSNEEAQKLVGAPGSRHGSFSNCGVPNWALVESRIT